MTYQGSTNYETWNVELWVDNEKPLYLKKVRLFDRSTEPITAKQVKEFVDGYLGGCTPDLTEAGMLKVNWEEIAESWETGRQEHWLYKFDAANEYDTFDEYLDDKTDEVQKRLAPYDLGIEDEEIRELILDEEGDLESVIEGYIEDLPPPQDDQPVHLGES